MPRGTIIKRSGQSVPGSSPASPTFEGCVNVPPGANRTAVVQVLIAAGTKNLCFGEGQYTFEGPVFAGLTPAQVSGTQLIGSGDGRTVFNVSYSPGGGSVDDPTQALLFYDAAPDGAVATTVAAGIAAIVSEFTFTVTAPAGIVAGQRLRIQGHNAPGLPNDAVGMSDGAAVVLTEMVTVLGVAGSVVTLTSPLLQWHAPGSTVVSVQPVTEVVVRGIYFNFAGAGASTVSNAIYTRCVDGVYVEDCWFRSMTRAGCEFGPGTRTIRADKLRGRGLLNGLCFGDSCMLFRWEHFVTDTDVERWHTLGFPRHFVFCQNRCTAGQRTHFKLQHGSAGMTDFGGWEISTDDFMARDMDSSAMRIRTVPFYSIIANVGLGIESGAAPLGFESFAYALTYDNVDLFDLFSANTFDYPWFWHDIIDSQIGRCCISNKGPTYGTVTNGITYNAQGFICNDIQGESSIGELQVSGCTFGWFSYGGTPVEISQFDYDGATGTGGGSIGLYINNSIAPGGAPRFHHVSLLNVNGNRILFGPQFLLVPDFVFQIDELRIENERWQGARLIRNNDAGPTNWNVGDVVIIDPAAAAGETGALTPTSTKVDMVVCVGGPLDVATGLMMAAPLPGRVMTVNASAAAVLRGAQIRGSGAGLRTVASIAGPAMNLCGDALTAKGAGAGPIVIGPRTCPEPAPGYFDQLAVDVAIGATTVIATVTFTSVGTHPVEIWGSWSGTQTGAVGSVRLRVDGVVVNGANINNGAATQECGGQNYRVAALAPGVHTIDLQVVLVAGAFFIRPVTQPNDEFANIMVQEIHA